jgi:hypothetical protein
VSDENTLIEGSVPPEFWAVPEKFIKDESLRLLHAEVCSRLRGENSDADTLELMAIERITSLFFYMRDRERIGGLASDAAYKSMLSLWVTMAADLRKSRSGLADEQSVRQSVMKDVASGVKKALQGLDPEVASVVRRRFAESLGAS